LANSYKLLVVIINYKTPELVCEAIDSLRAELNISTCRVVVVDNNSADSSVDIIGQFIDTSKVSSWVEVISAEVNGGFSAGNNKGIQSYEAEYYLLLNSDAYVRKGAISKMLDLADRQPRTGVVGPRLEWPDGEQQVSLFYDLTPLNSFLASAKLGIFTNIFSWFGSKEVAIPIESHDVVKPDWVSFACVLLRAEMVAKIGLMDEGYFMYREDNDYCRRATNAGWELAYESSARVVHLNQGASNQLGIKRLPRFYFESRSRYFLKYYGRAGLLLANITWSLGRFISMAREKLTKKSNAFHRTMLLDIWIGFSSHIKEK
jgi:GT2 family glycosyltransferase